MGKIISFEELDENIIEMEKVHDFDINSDVIKKIGLKNFNIHGDGFMVYVNTDTGKCYSGVSLFKTLRHFVIDNIKEGEYEKNKLESIINFVVSDAAKLCRKKGYSTFDSETRCLMIYKDGVYTALYVCNSVDGHRECHYG